MAKQLLRFDSSYINFASHAMALDFIASNEPSTETIYPNTASIKADYLDVNISVN